MEQSQHSKQTARVGLEEIFKEALDRCARNCNLV